MKELRLIVTVPVEGDISIGALRTALKARIRTPAEPKPVRYERDNGDKGEMIAHYELADVRMFGRKPRGGE